MFIDSKQGQQLQVANTPTFMKCNWPQLKDGARPYLDHWHLGQVSSNGISPSFEEEALCNLAWHCESSDFGAQQLSNDSDPTGNRYASPLHAGHFSRQWQS